MVGQPSLGKVVGADALGAVARAHLLPARLGPVGVKLAALGVVEAGLQHLHRLGAVLVLGLLRGGHHDAGGKVGDPHRRVGLVDVLAARAGRAIGVNAEVFRLDVDDDGVVDLRRDER